MAKKNESELICNSQKRQLTAKGYRFLNRCVDVLADVKGCSRYTNTGEFPVFKKKLTEIIVFLIIDQKKSIAEIKELIKNRRILIQ